MSLGALAAAAALFFVAACGATDGSEERTAGADTAPSSALLLSASAPPAATAEMAPAAGTTPSATSEPGDAAEVGRPARIVIPAIDVDADLVELGLNDDGSMETPEYDSNLAGWYIEGPKPGEAGPAVVAAHVDNADGSDTFARLHELEPGDEIVVTDDLGNEYNWSVERSQVSSKRELPYDEIWNNTSQPVLRLITCTGAYVDGSYAENLIVYAA